MTASFSSYEGCAQTGQRSSEELGHTVAGRGALRWKTLTDHSSCCRNLTPKSEDVSQGWGDAAVVFSSRNLSCHCFSQMESSGDAGESLGHALKPLRAQPPHPQTELWCLCEVSSYHTCKRCPFG